eukprot:scaffold110062_cov20-Tisochrysis_lutea.AAC.1
MPEARGRQYKVGLEAWLSTTGVCWKHAACCIGVTAAWDEASTIAAHQGVDLRTAKAEGQQSQALGDAAGAVCVDDVTVQMLQ